MTHYVKTLPENYCASASGLKPFTVRRDDRGYNVGDTIVSQEWTANGYTGNEVSFLITFKLPGGQYGIEKGYCVLGIWGGIKC